MEFDVCAANHGGNLESVAAFKKINPILSSLRLKVLLTVDAVKAGTVKEITDASGLERLTVAARLTELKYAGFVVRTDDVRDGCRVLALSETGKQAIQLAKEGK